MLFYFQFRSGIIVCNHAVLQTATLGDTHKTAALSGGPSQCQLLIGLWARGLCSPGDDTNQISLAAAKITVQVAPI